MFVVNSMIDVTFSQWQIKLLNLLDTYCYKINKFIKKPHTYTRVSDNIIDK